MRRVSIVALFIASLCGISWEGFGQQNPSFALRPAGAVTVRVSTSRITNLIFPGVIRTGIKVSNDIMVQKVKGVENVIELKAMRKGFVPTSVSVFAVTGRVYSFLVEYSDSARDFDFLVSDDTTACVAPGATEVGVVLTGMPVNAQTLQADGDSLSSIRFLNRSGEYERVRLRLRGIYLKDSLLWLAFDLRNRSLVPYKIDYLRVYSTDKKKVKRAASHETDIEPKYLPRLPVAGGQATIPFCAAFEPFTLSKGERLWIEVGETNGARTIKLRLKAKILLNARQ